jgi:hypothetical protein
MLKEKVENLESITYVYYCGMFPLTMIDHLVPDVKAAFKEHAVRRKKSRSTLG